MARVCVADGPLPCLDQSAGTREQCSAHCRSPCPTNTLARETTSDSPDLNDEGIARQRQTGRNRASPIVLHGEPTVNAARSTNSYSESAASREMRTGNFLETVERLRFGAESRVTRANILHLNCASTTAARVENFLIDGGAGRPLTESWATGSSSAVQRLA